MKLDYINFPQRADRSRYIARRFAPYLQNSLLDVGCDKAVLRGLLARNVAYTGIDIGGTPDMVRPQDRHKWFFGFTEAVEFLRAQEQLFAVSVVEMVANEKPRLALVRAWRHMRYRVRERYVNRYAHTVWAVFKKRVRA